MEEQKPPLETPATAALRSRELYKYFIPPGTQFPPTKVSTTQSVLSAYAQLVAWRMDTRRALVSLIDKDIQYFVAESAKTLNIEDRQVYTHQDSQLCDIGLIYIMQYAM
jgi:hypothetical protein